MKMFSNQGNSARELVAHACNPGYSRGSRFKVSPGKWFGETPISKSSSQK
jgi:hypothetical protein